MADKLNQHRKSNTTLSYQAIASASGEILGELGGIKKNLSSSDLHQRLAALSKLLKHGQQGFDLLTEQALKDESEQMQQAAYWALHDYNPYLTELDDLNSPNEPIVPTDTISCVAISPDKQILAGGSWRIIRLWRLGTGERFRTIDAHSNWVLSVAISPDGNTLVSGSADKTIKLWNLKSGQLLRTLNSHSSWVNVVVISPDGKTLISGSADKTIKMWNLSNGKLLRTLKKQLGAKGHAGSVCSLAVSSDGLILASGSTDHTVKLWNLKTKKLLHTLKEHLTWVQAIAISPNGQTLVSGDCNGHIKIWRIALQYENKLTNSVFNKLIFFLILACVSKFTTGAVFVLGVPLIIIASIILANRSKSLKSLSVQSFECTKGIAKHSSSVNSLNISPDGLNFISGSDDNVIKLWNSNTEKFFIGHSGFVSSIATSADGEILVSGSNDWVMLWNLQTGEPLHPLQGCSRLRLSKIVISPPQVQLEYGKSCSFSIKGLDGNGQEMQIEQVVWQATNGNISARGVFTAGYYQSTQYVTAIAGAFRSYASVTVVEPPRLTRLVITPQQVQVEFGQSQTFKLQALDQRSNYINIRQVSWQTTGGDIDTNGNFRAGQSTGSITVTATVGAISSVAFVKGL